MLSSVVQQQMTVMKMQSFLLQTIIENCPRRNSTTMMGESNAKTGSDNTGYEEIMGQHGLEEMNTLVKYSPTYVFVQPGYW